ncbi:hypothetical protein [Sorangium sp. So ce394]|uniref:hypothetical protein n=1 Tax=Sorangium sp. So ce394 TaxID=3133310 RepID=UPI003F5C777C
MTIAAASKTDLYAFLAEHLRPRFQAELEAAGPGQRLRVTTLPEPVMDALCASLQDDPRWVARVLAPAAADAPWKATATKLIELRNVLPAPLLVFLPPGKRTAAEDSLDIATFTELSLATVASDLVEVMFEGIPEPLQGEIREVIDLLRRERDIRNDDEKVEYLLTVRKNGGSRVAAGAALYVFGLLPDFRLFERGSTLFWLTRNRGVCEKLREAAQPLQARLGRLPVKPGTIQGPLFAFLRTRHASDIRVWAREIATDPTHRELALDCWDFIDEGKEEDLRLLLDPLSLPKQTEDKVSGTLPMPVLNVGDKSKETLKVAFRAIPSPAQAPSWKTWRVQILSVAEGQASVAWESNSFPKPATGRRAAILRNLKAKDLAALEEGTYYLKIDAYDADGALLTKPRRVKDDDPTSRAENESEPFLVVRESVDVIADEVRAVFVSSLLEAWVDVAAKCLGGKQREPVPDRAAIRGAWDQTVDAPPKGEVYFELSTEGFAGYTVRIPALLRAIELTLLGNPEHLSGQEVSFVDVRKVENVVIKPRQQAELGALPEAAAFLAVRQEVFHAIREHHFDAGKPEERRTLRSGLVETVDLTRHAEAIERYARAYVALAGAAMHADLEPVSAASFRTALAQLDTVELRWRHGPGDPGRALLLAPTHPLRLLWHLAHARMIQDAVSAWSDGSERAPDWRELLDQLVAELLPMNLPMVLFDRRRRPFVEHAPLTAFWPLYLPDRAEGSIPVDAMAARDRVLRVLGVRDRATTVTTVDPDDLAWRLFEYLEQHPYVEQLCINVFNSGDGRLVADVLRGVEALRADRLGSEAPSIRYAVHLFAGAGRVEAAADGLESLLDPDRQVGEEDEFTLASHNHLLPKLVFAQNALADFLQAPERYAAHVSLLLEQFTVLGSVGRVDGLRRGSFVAGLVQEPETQVEPLGAQVGWVKGLRPGSRRKATLAEELLRESIAAAQRVQAAFAHSAPAREGEVPVTKLQLSQLDQALLKQVHEVSDWVLTVDRNLGIDFFDSPSSAREAGYLLDFAPEYLQEDRQRILLSTRSTLEIEGLIRPILDAYGLGLRPGEEIMVLDTLRSISGRLALRLEGGRTQAAEVVGLLLARWLLEREHLLEQRIVVPLDAHRTWFAGASASEEGPTSRRRADLLLVGFGPKETIRLDIVEVKLREELSGPARAELYREMHEQIQSTMDHLRDRFALDRYSVPRADALLRAKELGGALAFYARRASRYGLLSDAELARALAFVENLDDGYTLDMRACGVLFEHRSQGVDVDEEEPGFVVYRLGGDKAKQLLAHAAGRFADRSSRGSERRGTRPTEPPTADTAALDADLESFREALSLQPPAPPAPSPTPYVIPPPRPPHHAREPVLELPLRAPAPPAAPVVAAPSATLPSGTAAPVESVAAGTAPVADLLLGATEMTPQHGVLGKFGSQKVGLDLTGCNTISLFGVQGFGKSYTLGVIAEMAAASFPGINALPSPLATVLFHYHKSDAYEPEFVTAVSPNRKQNEVDRLLRDYGARPDGLRDVVLLTPEAKVEQRRRDYPGIVVEPIKFSSAELKNDGWKFLLGAYGNEALYLRQLNAILRRHRDVLTLEKLREELREADLSKSAARLAEDRLRLAEPYIDDTRSLGELLQPGRTIIVDLRDEWIEKDEALELFVVMMRIFAAQERGGHDFNKLIVFDEAHKYITESELVGQVVETIREMRHHATSIVLASQDPISVPRVVIELSTVLVLHRMTSPQWLRHLKTAIVALEGLEEIHLAALSPGEALVWSQRSTDKRFMHRPQKVTIRPRVTQHGGGTKTAVAGVTVK